MDDFDHVPKPKPVPYKYVEPLPKKKRERRHLPAQPCEQCEQYYASFPNANERAHASCRHRGVNKRPKTPPHFWELDFPSYDIPKSTYTFKPLWQNKYHNTLSWDPKLYDGLNMQLIPYFDPETSQTLLDTLEKEIVYLHPELCRVTVQHAATPPRKIPRQMAVYGDDEDITYTFSGNTYRAKPWTRTLLQLRDVASELTGGQRQYNLVVINRYKNGNDWIGFHKDDEPDLDPHACIVSFSLGAERTFLLKRPHFPNFECVLPSGSVLILKPPTNKYWYHGIPVEKEVKDKRINLTFRMIRPRRSHSSPMEKHKKESITS